MRINLPVLIEKIEEIGKALPLDRIYDGATLFARGEASGYIESIDEMTISQQFPKAQIVTISGAGHWLHADNPSHFFDEITGFLRLN